MNICTYVIRLYFSISWLNFMAQLGYGRTLVTWLKIFRRKIPCPKITSYIHGSYTSTLNMNLEDMLIRVMSSYTRQIQRYS